MLLLLLLQGGINLASYWQIDRLLITNKSVLLTHNVIYSISELWNNLLEMQNSVRSYVITGNPIHINDYEKKAQLALSKIERLKPFVRNKKYLDNLNNLLQQRITYFHEVISIYQKQGEEAAEQLMSSDKGLYFAKQVSTLVGNMHNDELNLLNMQEQVLQKDAAATKEYLLVINISSFLFIGLFLIIFNWQYSKAVQINRMRRLAENQLKGIISGTNDGIAAVDTDYNLIVFNQSFERCFFQLFGKTIAHGINLKELLADLPHDQHFLINNLKQALNEKNEVIIQQIGSSNLTSNIYEITYSDIRDKKGLLIGATLIAREVSERIMMEKSIKKTNEQLAISMSELKQQNQAISLLNLLTSALQSCLSVSETFIPITTYAKKILPLTAGRLYLAHPSRNYLDFAVGWGKPLVAGESIFSPEQCWALRRGQVHRFYDSDNSIPCEHLKITSDIPSYLCIPLLAQNDNIGLLYLEFQHPEQLSEEVFYQLVAQQDSLIISFSEAIASSIANIKLRDTLRIRSIRDPLTGLYNRSYLEESFAREIQRAKRHNTHLAVIMIDLDHFKNINDTYGHDAGDMVLAELSKRLLKEIRQTDIACRYGGEEILLLVLEITTIEEIYDRMEVLRQAISLMEFLHHDKLITNITASFGIALMPEHGDTPTQLIEAADRALYQSKKDGRNRITVAN